MHQLRIALRSMIPIILHLHTATPNNVGWVIANSLSIMINEYTNEWSHIVIFSPHRFISFNTQYIFFLFLLLPRLSWIIWFHVEKEIDGSHIYQQFSWQIVQYANILAWWFYGDKFFFYFTAMVVNAEAVLRPLEDNIMGLWSSIQYCCHRRIGRNYDEKSS